MLIALIAAMVVTGSDDPEGVVTTAPGGAQSVVLDASAPTADAVPSVSTQAITPHGLTTEQQIQHWVGARDADTRPFASDRMAEPRDDRTMHGEVSAAGGTGDYTAFGARVSIPFGENGRVDLSYSQSKNSPWGLGYGYGGYGYGPDALRYGPGYRGAYDPFFYGSGIVTPGAPYGAPRAERPENKASVED